MDEELEKVKKRIEKRLEQYDQNDDNNTPMNDAMDHLQRYQGYPSGNPSKMNLSSLPLPIRIVGYVLLGSMGVGMLVAFIMNIIHSI